MPFLDDLGKKMTNIASAAADKSKQVAESAKLNILITQEEIELKKLYQSLGKLYYEENYPGVETPYDETCIKIATSLKTIDNYMHKKEKLKRKEKGGPVVYEDVELYDDEEEASIFDVQYYPALKIPEANDVLPHTTRVANIDDEDIITAEAVR
jgi:hypothetical protein